MIEELSKRIVVEPSPMEQAPVPAVDPQVLKSRFGEAFARGDRDGAVAAWMELNRSGKEAFPALAELLKHLPKSRNWADNFYRYALSPEFCEWILLQPEGGSDPFPHAKSQVAFFLMHRYPERVFQVITPELILGEKDRDSNWIAMLEALAWSPDPAVAGTLAKVAKGHSTEAARNYAVELLGAWSSPEAVQALGEIQASDPSQRVRDTAGRMLRKEYR